MKTKVRIAIATIGFLLIATLGNAQDFHMSQYDANPLYLNPALTGMRMNEDWNFRANANYRQQWNKLVGIPYAATVAAAFDKPLNEKFSIGEYIIDDNGVNGSFNTFNFMLSGAYNIIHKKDIYNPHNFSIGLQMGLLQQSLNPADFVYDSQYSSSAPDGFDKSLPSGENFKRQNIFNFDANMGIYYRFIDTNERCSPFGGFSIYHLTQPNESFIAEKSKLPMRFNLNGGLYYRVTKQFSILTQLLYMNQANANDLNLGILGFYKIQGTFCEPMMGFAWRNMDAVILHLGLKQKNYVFRISYDINTSYLKQYSSGGGGLELSIIIYTGKKKAQSAPSTSAEEKKLNK